MARLTIAQLTAQLEAERHNNEQLRAKLESRTMELSAINDAYSVITTRYDLACAQIDQLRAALDGANADALALAAVTTQRDQLRAQLAAQPAPAPAPVRRALCGTVYEFDPTIPGDFARASQLAREHRGTVRRVSR